ncbi:MAG TPA: GlsB/YeaQ/YmgE family stress response membrane protein [Gemmatimonadaceae bacterium]|nr:GlsB/YeaQ/YmgE family stress response membrane protein [Gemmatimonadaceae bacterium]
MAIITTIIIGLIVGVIAKFLMPGKDPGGFIVTTIIGIAGAFLGTFVGRALGMYEAGESAGWLMSIVGAILLLFIYRLFTRRAPPA